MNLGRLDRKISIEQPTASADSFGGAGAVSWTQLASVWARMETSFSSESIAADRIESSYPIKWTMHYLGSITNNMRIIYEGDTYEIKGIREVTRRHLMEVQTELVE